MIVSNSQVTSFNTCKRQHRYAYVENLEPRVLPHYLDRGNLGHIALAKYYESLKNGACYTEAKELAIDSLVEEMTIAVFASDLAKINLITDLINLLEKYFEYYESDLHLFNIIKVEEVFTYPLSSGINYGMRLDLLVELKTGVYKGDLILIDHKFIYNFKSDKELDLDAQGPKYVACLRANNYPVRHFWFNQLRYRQLKNTDPNKIFQRTPIVLNNKEIEIVWNEQISTAEKIANTDYDKDTRTLNPIVCKTCLFDSICKTERMDQDATNLRIVHYQPNTYGYVDYNDVGIDIHG